MSNTTPEVPTKDAPQKKRVAFLGEGEDRTSYGAIAAEHFFYPAKVGFADPVVEFIPLGDHTSVLDALWDDDVDYGVVAIENAVDGVVNETARGVAQLTARGVHVLEEVVIPVTFYLASKTHLELDKPILIYAHPTAKGQCLRLKRRLEQICDEVTKSKPAGAVPTQDNHNTRVTRVKVETVGSNSAAAIKAVSMNAPQNSAALVTWEGVGVTDKDSDGNLLELKLVDLKRTALPRNQAWPNAKAVLELVTQKPSRSDGAAYMIADSWNSTTRFWKLGHDKFTGPVQLKLEQLPGGRKRRLEFNRTSILLNLDHDSPGGLKDALQYFSDNNCNLSIVYPIPIPGRPFEYVFLLEYEDRVENGKVTVGGHIDSPDFHLRESYEALRGSGLSLNPPAIFGAYPTKLHPADCSDEERSALQSSGLGTYTGKNLPLVAVDIVESGADKLAG
jgi:prephenate dehydratase